MTREEFEIMLQPAAGYIKKQKIIAEGKASLNYLIVVLLFFSLALIALRAISCTIWNIDLPVSIIATVYTVLILAGIAIFIMKMPTGYNYIETASYLDHTSNNKNAIKNAYSMLIEDKTSDFASLTVESGISKLQTVSYSNSVKASVKLRKTLAFAAIFAVGLNMVSLENADVLGKSQGSVVLTLANSKNDNLIADSINKNSNKESTDFSGSHSDLSLNSHMANNDNVPTDASGTSNNSANADMPWSKSGKSAKDHKTSQSVNSEIMKGQTNSKSGSAQTPNAETAVTSNIISGAPQDNDQSAVEADDRQHKPSMNSAVSQPFLDDKNSAPSRELGRSGKDGSPGSGRGGMGTGKKSRATASILSGEKIRAFIKSRQGKGRSKSFEIAGPLMSSEYDSASTITTFKSKEGAVAADYIEKQNREIVKKYFKELTTYANTMFTTSQR